jgi:hypothetical protein
MRGPVQKHLLGKLGKNACQEESRGGIQMLANKFIAAALGLGLLISLVVTFGSDETLILLAALFG